MDENDMIEADFDGLSDSEVLVLLFMDEGASTFKTRLQKLSLLYHELYDAGSYSTDHHAYFFGGYSDDIDESATNLTDMGILDETEHGYELTEYGIKLRRFFQKEYDDEEQMDRIDRIKKAVSLIPDRNLVGLTYHFYQDSAKNSTIKKSVDRMNSSSIYDGVPLNDYPLSLFEEKLRKGDTIRAGNRWLRNTR